MLTGQGQICFISGEAGSGKTTLIGEFTRLAQESNADLLVTLGECDYAEAALFYEDALKTAQLIDIRMGQGIVMMTLGDLYNIVGDYDQSKFYSEKALVIMREVGYRMGEDIALCNLGQNAYVRGEYESARVSIEQALTIAKEIEDRVGEGILLYDLGAAHIQLGQPE
jgi:tetratricopeptide (TPR) repeat protein